MQVAKSVDVTEGMYPGRGGHGSRWLDGPSDGSGWRRGPAPESRSVVYLDPHALTRDCVGRWLEANLGFGVRILSDLGTSEAPSVADSHVRAVLVNIDPERMTAEPVARLLSRLGEALPDVPFAVLSSHEDPESIRVAFELGVSGYIPTSLPLPVVLEAVHLVCAGGTFAPTAALLSRNDRPPPQASEPQLEGFTRRQAQILDCLRRGMANKLIAYELDMCESTVKVHVRNIMRKLKATNRTEVAYLTRDLFDDSGRPALCAR